MAKNIRQGWLVDECNCPAPKKNRIDPGCFHGLLKIRRQIWGGKYIVENNMGYIRIACPRRLVFDPEE